MFSVTTPQLHGFPVWSGPYLRDVQSSSLDPEFGSALCSLALIHIPPLSLSIWDSTLCLPLPTEWKGERERDLTSEIFREERQKQHVLVSDIDARVN